MTKLPNHENTRSIRTRLIFFYTLAVFVLLGIVAIFLYWATISLLYKADYEFLANEIDTIHYLLENEKLNKTALKEAIVEAPLQTNQSMYRYYIRVYDANENVIMATPNFESVVEPGKKLRKITGQPGKMRYFWYKKNDKNYLLAQSPVNIGAGRNDKGYVQAVLDISYQHDIIHDKKNLIFLLLIGTLISLIFGFIITNRGLRSLYLLTQAVQKITATSLDQRIDPKSWPKELSGIGMAFNQMLERIEASFIRLKQFSADLSHEMRTPVNNLIGQTEVALTYTNDIDECKKVMESNLEEMQGLSTLIENILFIARADNPNTDLQKKLINIRQEIMLLSDYYQTVADEKNIKIICEGDAGIKFNLDMFRRMISNLLSNALKYTPANGFVKFTVREINKQSVEIVVEDNGVGIASDDLPRIFDRFYRGDAPKLHQSGGMGLGLAIVKSIIETHHGTISIASEPDIGTFITITLPRFG